MKMDYLISLLLLYLRRLCNDKSFGNFSISSKLPSLIDRCAFRTFSSSNRLLNSIINLSSQTQSLLHFRKERIRFHFNLYSWVVSWIAFFPDPRIQLTLSIPNNPENFPFAFLLFYNSKFEWQTSERIKYSFRACKASWRKIDKNLALPFAICIMK